MKLIRISATCAIITVLAGCQSMNSRLGFDSTDYTQAKELPSLKFPAGSLAVSKRYDIPDIPGDKDQIVDNDMPPDYQ